MQRLPPHSNQISGLEPGDLTEMQMAFMQNVSHELRTPLAIVLGYAELLRNGSMGELDPEQSQAVVTIAHYSHELRELVDRITTLLAVRMQATPECLVSLPKIVTQVVEELRPQAEQAGLALEMLLEPPLPLITGEAYQLQQAVACLLENALKFTPAGGQVTVHIYTRHPPAYPSSQVCLAVTDTGIGIKPDQLQHIFTDFYQIDSSLTRAYPGLGLTLTKAVVEAHNGYIEVTSQPEQGSSFTACFPIAMNTDAIKKNTSEPNPRSRQILIVDDEHNVAQMFRESLSSLPGCVVSVANSSEQALDLLTVECFDLVITDYKMPGADGLALAQEIQRRYPHTAVILVTAYISDQLRAQADQIAVRSVLAKPVSLTHIRKEVSSVLAQQPDYLGSSRKQE